MSRAVLITGANRGLGLALAEQLLAAGPYHVLAAARSWAGDSCTAAAAIEARRAAARGGASVEFMEVDVPDQVQGKSFWPLVTGERERIRDYAFSSRFPPTAGSAGYAAVEGATFDGWAGSDRTVEPSTVTSDGWAYLAAPAGMPSELYNLHEDPAQTNNVIDQHPDLAQQMRQRWLDFLAEHGAPESRLRPFLDANVALNTPHSGELWAFRDDHGQWIAYPSEREARAAAYRENAPGPQRQVERITFGALLADNPKNLVRLYSQYYWAQDLA